MCMLSYYGPGVIPVREHLDNGALNNPDGHGYAIIDRDWKLITGKGMKAAEIIDEFLDLRGENPEGPALFHSRISTSGRVNEHNCHPFRAGGDPDTVIAHNGILFHPEWKDRRSDTRIFAEDIFPRKYRRLDRDSVRASLREYLTGKKALYPNKMVILTVNPRYKYGAYLFGADKGDWVNENGVVFAEQVPGVTAWHSNTGYASPPAWKKHTAGTRHWWDEPVPAEEKAWWNTCPFCGYPQAVDPDTAICSLCGICTDCAADSAECMCYIPAKLQLYGSTQ